MGAIDLRTKWIQSIAKVDDRFLRMVDALYASYTKNEEDEVDFFVELPLEIQELLIESRKQANNGRVKPHKEVMAKYRKKYNIHQ